MAAWNRWEFEGRRPASPAEADRITEAPYSLIHDRWALQKDHMGVGAIRRELPEHYADDSRTRQALQGRGSCSVQIKCFTHFTHSVSQHIR